MRKYLVSFFLLIITILYSSEDAYRIKVGDKFLIQVYNDTRTHFEIDVNPDGKISYYLSPSLYVLGMTIEELREALAQNLRLYYKDPIVMVNPLKFSRVFAVLFGELQNPGVQDVNTPLSVIQAVAKASGFRRSLFRNQYVETADLEKSFLIRKGALVPTDFENLFRRGDLSQNHILEHGDLLYFPSKFIKKIYVLGRVKNPRNLGFLQQISVTEAIAEAGGLQYEADSEILVIRGSLYNPLTYTLNIDKILRGQAPNFILNAGDIVYVPTYRFQTLTELLKAGVFAFATTLAIESADAAYISIQPRAAVLSGGLQGTIPISPPVPVSAAAAP